MNGQQQPVIVLTQNQPQEMRQRPTTIMVPPRVQWAMNFIAMTTQKTQTHVAIGGGSFDGGGRTIEKIDGQKLTPLEQLTHNAACKLLEAYFAGRFEPDIWEQPVQKSMAARTRRRGTRKDRKLAMLIQCPSCGGGSFEVSACKVCGGDGSVAVLRRKDL